MLVSIIVAMGADRVIGVGGKLPWRLPEDLKRFKARTLGHTIIMGRKTFESMGRALAGRRNLVISRNPSPRKFAGVEWVTSLAEGIAAAKRAGETECFLGGGTAVYAEGLQRADRMYVTYVGGPAVPGDAYFPPWDEREWREVKREAAAGMEFVEYQRRQKDDVRGLGTVRSSPNPASRR
jgi:dihydrofolate reductase